jgi:hypothetical protein
MHRGGLRKAATMLHWLHRVFQTQICGNAKTCPNCGAMVKKRCGSHSSVFAGVIFMMLGLIGELRMIFGKVGHCHCLTMIHTTVTCRYDFYRKKVADLTEARIATKGEFDLFDPDGISEFLARRTFGCKLITDVFFGLSYQFG